MNLPALARQEVRVQPGHSGLLCGDPFEQSGLGAAAPQLREQPGLFRLQRQKLAVGAERRVLQV
ncbi:MAG: hypothetical protein WD100_01625, partial [Tistlia sp.]